jgi:hypothetical protein
MDRFHGVVDWWCNWVDGGPSSTWTFTRWCIAGTRHARPHRPQGLSATTGEEEGEKVKPMRGSPEHERRRRGGATAMKIDGGSSSV